MPVNNVGSSSPVDPSVYAAQPAERAEAKGAGGREVKNDHDGDDRASAVGAGSSTNFSGQTVGLVINKTA